MYLIDLFGADRLYGTGVHTGLAINTGFRIDMVLFLALTDRINWTFVYTCTTKDALVRNYVGQDLTSLYILPLK